MQLSGAATVLFEISCGGVENHKVGKVDRLAAIVGETAKFFCGNFPFKIRRLTFCRAVRRLAVLQTRKNPARSMPSWVEDNRVGMLTDAALNR